MDGMRLVGAGRLCLPVPAGWPTLGWGRVTRSHVRVLHSTAIFAVLFAPPPSDVVMVEIVAMPPRRPGHSVIPVSDWRPRLVAGLEAFFLAGEVYGGRWGIRIDSEPLDACLTVEGPREVCEGLVDSARPVPDEWTTVPNVWVDHHGQGYGETARDDDYVRTLLETSGLRARLVGDPLGDDTHVVGCEPYPTSVVPAGTEVVVTVAPYDD